MSQDPEKIRKILSANLKARRKTLGISQEKLAELADLSAQTVNDIEGCRMWVSDKTIIKLCSALNLEAYQLLLPNFADINTASQASTSSEILLSLQNNIISHINAQFTNVIGSGAIQ
jgi:transcriptional regulator with XRE-family HTH domain